MEFIDTHAHLTDEKLKGDVPAILERAQGVGITKIVCVASGKGLTSSYATLELAKKYPNVYPTVGVHPLDTGDGIEFDYDELLSLAKLPEVVAIGETGLDFFYTPDTKEKQLEWFRQHIEIALKVNKPLIVHARNAGYECFKLIKELHAENVGGVFHCYAEDASFAKELRDLNFSVSFTGVLTFKRSLDTKEAAKTIPLEQIMLETDSPYLAPVPYRGKICEPALMLETAKVLAEIKGLSLEEVAEITTQNALKFFKID